MKSDDPSFKKTAARVRRDLEQPLSLPDELNQRSWLYKREMSLNDCWLVLANPGFSQKITENALETLRIVEPQFRIEDWTPEKIAKVRADFDRKGGKRESLTERGFALKMRELGWI